MKYIFESKYCLTKEDSQACLESVTENKGMVLIPTNMKLKAVVDEETGNIVFCNEEKVQEQSVKATCDEKANWLLHLAFAISVTAMVVSVMFFLFK